jgi:hypothetical protein
MFYEQKLIIKIWKENAKYEPEIHYQFLETKTPTTRHKQHYEFSI